MSCRRVYVHIGAPKTGTTYLQDRLWINTKPLAEHGIHFPSRNALASAPLSQFRAALDLLGQDWGGAPGHAKGGWDALARRARRLDGTVILSHEILAPASAAQAARAKESLARGDAELHVVYSARDLTRAMPAAWQESIKQGRTWSYRRFLRRTTALDSGKAPFYARAFDLPAVLSTWSAGLPPERVHVVTVPRAGADDELWLRFANLFGIEPEWAPRESALVNSSLGAAEAQVLRQLNRRLRKSPDLGHDDMIRRLLAKGRWASAPSAPILLPPRYRSWADAQAERWIEWLVGSGVHVVGDVEDLRPDPPAAGVGYDNPDRVGSRRQLRAALDALAAVTVEAARRPDPDDTVGVKVRNRVRARRDG